VVADTIEGRGFIIDSQSQWGGYPKDAPTYKAFDPAAWNLADMTAK
jgi:predicted methyltransferase